MTKERLAYPPGDMWCERETKYIAKVPLFGNLIEVLDYFLVRKNKKQKITAERIAGSHHHPTT